MTFTQKEQNDLQNGSELVLQLWLRGKEGEGDLGGGNNRKGGKGEESIRMRQSLNKKR